MPSRYPYCLPEFGKTVIRNGHKMRISVITTALNAAGAIRDCLESVKGQTYEDVEQIVVDAASTDGTLEILQEAKDSCQSAVSSRQLRDGTGCKVYGSRYKGEVQGREINSEFRGHAYQKTENRRQRTESRELRVHITGKRNAVETPGTCPRNFFRVVSEPDNGIYEGMNKGLRLATGDVVGILNADDFYAGPDVLAKVAKVFQDPAVDSCYGDLLYVEEEPGDGLSVKSDGRKAQGAGITAKEEKQFKIVRYWKSGDFKPERFYWGWMVPHPTFFVRRSVYEKYGLFNLDLGSAADYELMLRFLVKHRISTVYIPEVLVKMRVGGTSNASLKNRINANRMDRKAWEVNGLRPYPWTIPLKPLRKIPQWLARP